MKGDLGGVDRNADERAFAEHQRFDERTVYSEERGVIGPEKTAVEKCGNDFSPK